jgi:hypothetical protein
VYFRDLMAYKAQSTEQRRDAISELAAQAQVLDMGY